MKIWTLYNPLYWAEASIDLYTAFISLLTALVLWPLIPKLLALGSPKELEQANTKLQKSIDIDRQKTAKLKAQAELLDLAHNAVMASDGTIRYWNKGAHEVYGYNAEEAIGKNYSRAKKNCFS